jgi:hypothetical protein
MAAPAKANIDDKRISNISKILKGTYAGIPATIVSAGNVLTNPVKSASSFWKSLSFSGVSGSISPKSSYFPTGTSSLSSTFKYVTYVLIFIVTLIALVLFLQSLGVNVIQERWGANGYIPSPFGDQTLKYLSDSQANTISSTAYTINIPISISSNIVNNIDPVPILLFYRGIEQSITTSTKSTNNGVTTTSSTTISNLNQSLFDLSGSLTAITSITKTTPPNNIDLYFNTPVGVNPYQFAISLDGLSKDLNISFYDSASNKYIALLQNPPTDVVFNLTIVVNVSYVEVYSNGLLTKTFVFDGNTIYVPSTAKFNIIANPNITIDKSTVGIWGQPLLASEVGQITLLKSNTPGKKTLWSKLFGGAY